MQSLYPPNVALALPNIHSISCPIVILLGIACGFIIISGEMPSALNGICSCGYIIPTVPFCAHREANLSPIIGILSVRIRILTNRKPSAFLSVYILSTNPDSLVLKLVLQSLYN